MVARNELVPENFHELYRPSPWTLESKAGQHDAEARKILREIVEKGYSEFLDQGYVIKMNQFALIDGRSDEELSELIETLKSRGRDDIAQDWINRMQVRDQNPDWKDQLEKFRKREATLFAEWRLQMREKDMSHQYMDY